MDYRSFLAKEELDLGLPYKMNSRLILASASPRRKQLMPLIAESFEIMVSGAEEIAPAKMPNRERPQFFAKLKAESIFDHNPDSIVIGCDTAVFLDDAMLGKPKGREEAFDMLEKLSGRSHDVISGVCIISQEKRIAFSAVSTVNFRNLSYEEITEYIDSGEPFDKAGGYGIQGAACAFVSHVTGGCYNVIGFPVFEIKEELGNFLKRL